MQPSRERDGKPWWEARGAKGNAPLKIASKARAVRVTAHFRRLTPPSFAAQNPLQEAAIFIHADVPQGHGGSLSRPAAAFLAAQKP
jgi:hypothetical protein